MTKPCVLCDGPAHDADYCRYCQVRLADRFAGAKALVWVLAAVIAGILSAVTVLSQTVVTPEFLDRIAWAESRNNPRAVGKAGELGAYQLKAVAVRDVNKHFGCRFRHSDAFNQQHGRTIATAFCLLTERRLRVALGRHPTSSEVREAYRRGVAGFLRWRKTR